MVFCCAYIQLFGSLGSKEQYDALVCGTDRLRAGCGAAVQCSAEPTVPSFWATQRRWISDDIALCVL